MCNKLPSGSPKAIALEFGQRLKRARLNQNLTQKQVADSAWVSRRCVAKAEEGYVLLENLLAILVALDMTEQLDSFLPPQHYSPMQMLKIERKRRKRASQVINLIRMRRKTLAGKAF
ncbi:helix-turn-helix domain-containing protein [Acinetobacter gerneri]|uniref:helix-turn-helix domain-containing protein n=1 Tax=Acinetobacter gerneri TaxID=202952 RepID=UPI003A84C49D